MPTIIAGSEFSKSAPALDVGNINYEYAYPDDLNLKPGSKLHENLKEKILERARASMRVMQRKHDAWNEISKSLKAYTTEEDVEEHKKKMKSAPIIVPVTYATLETLLTYFVASFLQDPIFRYEATSPEDVIKGILLEHVIRKQTSYFKAGLGLHTQWRDSFAYGFGVVAPAWKRVTGKRISIKDNGVVSSVISRFIPGTKVKVVSDVTLFEGNELVNIDPFKYLPDTNVPINDVQSGEYVGWIDTTNRMALLNEEKASEEGERFNAKYLKHMLTGRSAILKYGRRDDELSRLTYQREGVLGTTTPIDVIYMYVDIIPEEWDLGSGSYPEKWFFALAGDQVILQATPLNLNHNLFPLAVASPDYDGYSVTPPARLDILSGMQETIDWLFSSHIANVRKAINDMYIVDPSMVNVYDLATPRPGKIIRTRKAMWGRGVKDVIQQLPVSDVTQGHIKDSSVIMDIINRTSSASESLQGFMVTKGERKSAVEARNSFTGAISRLQKSARIVGMQAMETLAYMYASHTQQLMEEETFVKIVGDYEAQLMQEFGNNLKNGRVRVRPEDIMVDYDIIPHDGSMPGGEPPDLWVNLFQVLGQSPELLQAFDIVKIFKHVARQLGAKNVNDFVRKGGDVNFQVRSDEAVQKEVDKGNLVPVTGG
jgi:hypothetical protein